MLPKNCLINLIQIPADKTDKLIFSAYSLTKEEISEIQGEFK